MKSVLIVLQDYLPGASATEEAVINYILSSPEEAANETVSELSKKTYTSQATIVRLCAKIGFSGYRDFRRALSAEIEVIKRAIREDVPEISPSDSIDDIAAKVTSMNIKSLEETLRIIDTDILSNCISLIESAGTVGLFGVGAGLVVARDAYIKMLRINKPCIFNDDWHNQRLQAHNLSSCDLAILITYSGKTREVIECARILKKNRCPIIAITQNGQSPIAQMSTYNIYIPSSEQTLRSGAMASRMAQMNVIDILYNAYAFKRYDGFKQRLAETYIQKGNDSTNA